MWKKVGAEPTSLNPVCPSGHMGPASPHPDRLRTSLRRSQKFSQILRVALVYVSGLCYITYMNTLDEIKTQVFCSQCGFVTSQFIEFGGEFWCEQECVKMLPTEADMEAEAASRMARELSSLMDEVDALGVAVTSEDSEDAVMARIEFLANYLSWFYPQLLDKRFS